jgi:hypothetical protein
VIAQAHQRVSDAVVLLFGENPQRFADLDTVTAALESLDDPVQDLKIIRPQLAHAPTPQVIKSGSVMTSVEEARAGHARTYLIRPAPAPCCM